MERLSRPRPASRPSAPGTRTTIPAARTLFQHLLRLGAVLVVGLILALIPLQATFSLLFVPTLALAIACCALLFWAISDARKLSGGSPKGD